MKMQLVMRAPRQRRRKTEAVEYGRKRTCDICELLYEKCECLKELDKAVETKDENAITEAFLRLPL